MMDTLGKARWFVAHGYSVIPLDHPADSDATDPSRVGKVPAVDSWKTFQTAPPTDEHLRAWFGNGRQRNIGLVTGAVSRLVVVDCDSPEAIRWADAHLPATPWRVKTGKGDHRGYLHPGTQIRNAVCIKTGDRAIKIDVRGDGGYVVAPESLHRSGVRYEWIGQLPHPPIESLPVFDPSWLTGESADAEPPPADPAAPTDVPLTDRMRQAREWLARQAPATQGEGGDAQTYRICCSVAVGYDLPETEAFSVLQDWNARCRPPWLPGALLKKIRNAVAYGTGKRGAKLKADSYPLTDTGNAEFFAAVAGDILRYDHGRRQWFVFSGHHWLLDRTEQVERIALAAVRDRQAAALNVHDEDRRKAQIKWSLQSESRAKRGDLVKLATKHDVFAVTGDDWDTKPWLLGVQNGVIDLQSGVLRDGRTNDHISKVAPVVFDESAQCPRWDRFVREIFADQPEVADYIQRVLGYTLTGITTEQVFWILCGLGANGKSTLLELLMHAVLGDAYAWTMPFPTTGWTNAMSEYQKASLVGQRLVQSVEVARRCELNDELIKSLTGGDTINARHPFGRPFQYVPIGKIFLRVNDKPIIRDQSHGMWRRVKLVLFNQTFSVNLLLGDELRAEAPGILAWAVRGCLDWQRDGLRHPAVVEAATEEYRGESDPLNEFLGERCCREPGLKIGAQAFFDAYVSWCMDRHLPDEQRLSQRAFGMQMQKRFSVDKKKTTTYLGVGLQGDVDGQAGGESPETVIEM